ncbi:MAG: hypothetical protein ISS33_03850 [Candidatus Omnitrophica bacterium]|nr:hypothetical protein [Candidatus Omnitrophota bacterium]
MKKNIVLGITGSIAAFKACELIGLLRKKGYSVQCVMSKEAEHFVTALTLETLSDKKVVKDMFSPTDSREAAHISLSEWADLILVAPATADVLSKVAAGICSNILICTIAAADCPIAFAPAMNSIMFNNPIIQEKIEYLKNKKYYFIEPATGRLACGSSGIGRLAPLGTIVEKVENILTS